MVAHICHPSYSGGEGGGSQCKASLGKNAAARAKGTAQVVGHLPGKYETLSSNPSTEKKKKELIF
jgi:hypothetical protein